MSKPRADEAPNYQAFADVLRVAQRVPDNKFDMTELGPSDGCGCALYHYQRAKGIHLENWYPHFKTTRQESWFIFSGFDYPEPKGAVAKWELLRRIRKVLGIAPGDKP